MSTGVGQPHPARVRTLILTLVSCLLVALGAGVVLPAAAHASTYDAWAATGDGTVTLNDDGSSSGTPSFSYDEGTLGGGAQTGSWTFLAGSSQTGDDTVSWNWTGNAQYCNAQIELDAYQYDSDTGATTKVLLNDDGGCTSGAPNRFPDGPFTMTNTYTFTDLSPNDTYGFDLSSSNFDSSGELSGTFSVNDNPSLPFVSSAPDANTSWQTATSLDDTDSTDATIGSSGENLWYDFPVQPDSDVTVSLANLPADDSISVFSDISQTFSADEQLLAGGSTTSDLTQLTAEQPGNAASPSAFSPSAFSPSAFSPSAFSPSAFSPSAFSPSAFSPSAFSPSAFSPSAFSPSAFSPSAFSPSAFSPSAFSPSAFSPSAFSAAYASAQVQSLLAISTQAGTANKSVTINTWNTTGNDYIRISGNNGASSAQPFELSVTTAGGPCVGVSLNTYSGDSTITGDAGSAQTVILTNPAKLDMTGALGTAVTSLAAATNAAVVDVSQSQKVTDLEAQAAANPTCPYAEDLVAQAIRDIVNTYRNGTGSSDALKYVVVIGDDDVIPFFRYADGSGLAPESDYVPPVSSDSLAAGALNSDDYLSDDAYGAATDLTLKGTTLPLPDLAVGRLVESPTEITSQINNYLADPSGQLPTPSSSLVTGYDFMQPAADEVESQFAAGLGTGATNDTLITDQGVSPSDTTVNNTPDRSHSWTATDLSTSLFGSHHDLLFLGGHFSANNTLAADYSSTLVTTDLQSAVAKSPNLFKNSLILAAGCHAGYNLEDADGVPDLTLGLDWPEALTAAGATLISGTGYQYGDTDFVAYSDKLYVDIAKELNAGTGSVAIGAALTTAKQDYLTSLDQLTGIDQKALLETTLYGLPMLGIDMPAGRTTATSTDSTISPSDSTTDPGQTLGLQVADLALSPSLVSHTEPVEDLSGNPTGASYTWLSGPSDDDITSEPSDPTLPLVTENVTVANTVLRGVGFMSGSYADLPGITPLTGAPTTELDSVHTPYTSPVFYPQTLSTPNYFGALSGGSDGTTNLLVTPAQDIQDGATTDTLRSYSQLGLRLFYDDNTTMYGSNTPALAGPPTISQVTSTVNPDGSVTVSGHVAGDPSAGIQNVWVTYTGATSGDPYYGAWQSVDLQQDPQNSGDSTLWTGTIPAPVSGDSNDVFMVQAVSGTGVVAMDNNSGAYFAAGQEVGAAPTGAATSLTLDPSNPTSGAFNGSVSVSATLSGPDSLAGRTVTFGLGSQSVQGTTDSNGVATAVLAMNQSPGSTYDLTASYAGSSDAQPASTDAAGFTINKASTTMTISGPSGPVLPGADPGVTATLTSGGQPLQRKTVIFAVDGPGGTETASVVSATNGAGQVSLGKTGLLAGNDTVTAYFGKGDTPLTGGGTVDGSDASYAESDASTGVLVSTSTTTQVSVSPSPVYDKPITLTAIVAPSDGTGTVAFSTVAGGFQTPIPNCGAAPLQLVSGSETATCTVPSADAGSYTVRADFSGTAAFQASHGTASSPVAQAGSATKLTVPNTATFGSAVTLSATVSTSAGRATGTVSFYDGTSTTPLSTVALPATGADTATFVVTGAQASTHAYRAVYSGDLDHFSSADASSTIVGQEATGTIVTAPGSAPYGQPVLLTATVTPSDGGGTVRFADGAGVIAGCTSVSLTGSAGSGKATCLLSGLAIGQQTFTAAYSGDGNLVTSTSGKVVTSIVKALPSLSVSAPASATYPAAVTVSATVAKAGSGVSPTGTVTFYDGVAKIGTASLPANGSGTVSVTLTAPGAASHTFQAVYSGDGNWLGASAAAATLVKPEASSTGVSAPTSVVFGQADTALATVTHTDGGGTVTFTANGTVIAGCGSVGLATSATGGTASCSARALGVGSYSLVAHYNGDANASSSVSTAASLKVTQAGSTVALTAPPTSRFGAPATFTAVVQAVAPGAGQPTGTVTFTSPAGVVGSALLQVGKTGQDTASVTVNGLRPGANLVTASYSGDPDFTSSTATATDVVGFTATVTGSHPSGVVIGAGQSVLVSGSEQGSIGVLPGGALEVTGTVTGSVAGPLGTTGVTLCGAKISGAVTVDLSPGWISIGGAGCSGTSIGGAVVLVGNTGGLSVATTTVGGSATFSTNSGHGPAQVGGVYPAPTISGNTITGTLACANNSPAPTDAGVSNKAAQRTGQCATPATF